MGKEFIELVKDYLNSVDEQSDSESSDKEESNSAMKYVRTKDGIYKVILVSPLGFVRIDKRDGTYPDVFEKDILKQADTVEELCGGFLVISEEYEEPHYVKKLIDTNALDYENNWQPYGNGKVLDKFCQKLIDAIIYGSIWVNGVHNEPILKPVARMNEKGEFELL